MAKHSNKHSKVPIIVGTVVVLSLLAVAGYLVVRYAPSNPFAESTFLEDVGEANQY